MEYYFITGSSYGIGKHLTEQLLRRDNVKVHGFSRHQTITHPHYSHHTIDLSKLDELKTFSFPEPVSTPEKIILVNNAGIIGDINFIGHKSTDKIIDTFTVNTIAPSILINQFLKQFSTMNDTEKLILNISSGAGRHSIAVWADYCASKAALDMYSEVFEEEQVYRVDNGEPHTRIFSIAPGIIDTNMQKEIRATDKNRFPYHETFVNYHHNKLLTPPEETARKLTDIIDNPAKYEEVILDLRHL